MTDPIPIFNVCGMCHGTGFMDDGSIAGNLVPCTKCSGTNLLPTQMAIDPTMFDDILDKCNDILEKCNDILEKVSEA